MTGISLLAQLPIDPTLAVLCDSGQIEKAYVQELEPMLAVLTQSAIAR